MAPIALEAEDHSRDAAFNKALHGKLEAKGFRSIISKDHEAHQAASEEYFKHWDNKSAESETPEIREVCVASLVSQRSITKFYIGTQERICHPHQTVSQ